MEYKYGSHTIYKIEYHFVFVSAPPNMAPSEIMKRLNDHHLQDDGRLVYFIIFNWKIIFFSFLELNSYI